MASLAYVAASANRFSHVADTSSEGLVAFGTSNFVALWLADDENDSGVSRTLPGHQAAVTCVRFIDDNAIVSGDEKGVLLLWTRAGSEWRSVRSIQAHAKPISAISLFRNILVTGASDSVVKIWAISRDDKGASLEEKQSISLKKRYPLTLALAVLPHSSVHVLAIGGTDGTVQLWLRSEDTFVHGATLAGHEDWIRALDFHQSGGKHPLVLASGSQDGTIRLWNIDPLSLTPASQESTEDDLLDAFEASLGEVGEGEEGGKQISLKRHILTVKSSAGGSQQFSVLFDALLVGHEAGITSIQWRPGTPISTPILLSTSVDSSIILWAPSTALTQTENGPSLWINYQRFGDVGGQRLGGFVGGRWGSTRNNVLAWGWSGGWRHWKCTDSSNGPSAEGWRETGAITGHSGPVRGLDWSPTGDYLISTGLDQTTRIHGGIPTSSPSPEASWHELARPQIHGYDLLNVTFIDPLKFVSIADEKVVRVFEAPRSFVDMLESLKVSWFSEEQHQRPAGASVPALGLSNKAVGEGTSQALAITDLDVTRRPFEGELAASTLWPEVEKLFGHGYESITLGISNSHRFVATACKSTSAEHAVVRIYDTQSFRPFGQALSGHVLTVTRIAFSPDDILVLTVSRDRTWRLFELHGDGFVPVTADKSHARIIWDCAWSQEGDFFATASRDKSVKIWQKTVDEKKAWSAVETIKLPEAATAVAVTTSVSQRRHLAVGLENGHICIYSSLTNRPKDWKLDSTIDSRMAHVDHIHRLAWRPKTNGSTQLASCSDDGTLRILNVQFDTD
ncbi:WD40 repeat-like protein [Coprinellus micaceus]|uniref:Elongator complex protein 2 n=1 Tax=Coprinellus micaceus TaxID=71717 RepID=A0A4Y7T7W7_COPMI|nr:WD40 repeat-like protein [Coprinellus micaceus]